MKSPKTNKSELPNYLSYDRIDSTGETALFYGFNPLKDPHIHSDDSALAKSISEGEIVVDHADHSKGATIRLEEKISLLKIHDCEKLIATPQPVMLYYKRPFKGDRRKINPKEIHHGLEIIGTKKSIAEAILIKTSMAILADNGETNLCIEINSIGDKESLTRFTRELTAYYRRYINELPAECKQLLKKDVFSLLGCEHEECLKLSVDCPKSINFLSEESRKHFKEVLEYIEALDIPYNINNSLVANRDYCSETIFEIHGSDPKECPKVIGIRYDTLSKKTGHRKEIPAVGVSIALTKNTKAHPVIKKTTLEKIQKPEICFMQLGFEAKLKSLEFLEIMRKARIPVTHSLSKDKIAGQVGVAEKMNAPIVIIMGKKEAMEDSVIVRETATRSQNTVHFSDVASYLKKYKV